MREEIIKMAREAGSIDSEDVIETVYRAFAADEREACAKVCETFYNHEAKDCAEAIRARGTSMTDKQIEKPADEPVAYSLVWDDVHCGNFFFREQDAKEHKDRLDTKYPSEHRKIVPLYTRPQPAREWVGLTMEDKQEYVAQDYGGNRLDAMDWAEKRLKEKNT